MKKIILLLCITFVYLNSLSAQEKMPPPFKLKTWEEVRAEKMLASKGSTILKFERNNAKTSGVNELPLDPSLKPFYHGVASGDPLNDRVIIWTRITPDVDGPVVVNWQMATDPQLQNVVSTGIYTAGPDKDYTVKIDVTGLNPGTTYYYNFTDNDGHTSLTGRTRTADLQNPKHLRFAVVSCSNYQEGYFNAYNKIAERKDIAAVIHLGDYIYEYGVGGLSNDSLTDRKHEPENEILTVSDYRIRHSLYKLDKNLRNCHQQHPFIPIWDDHETANNAYKDGADNHDPTTEGNWEDRKAAGKKAYFEWMPIRETDGDDTKIYRVINYGGLLEFIMLDTRLEGREKQVANSSDPEYSNPERTLLGKEQYQWFINKLNESQAKWKIIGNQVVFTPINTLGVIENMDMWDGYVPERDKIFKYIDSTSYKNMVIITGDIHIGIAADVAPDAANNYNPSTGAGSVAVEFVTPSITSSNLDEAFPNLDPTLIVTAATTANKHAKFVDVTRNGYFILDVNEDAVQADWYWMQSILAPNDNESQKESWYTENQHSFLKMAAQATPEIPNAPPFAPLGIKKPINNTNTLTVLGTYFTSKNTYLLHYTLSKTENVFISLFDLSGKKIKTIVNTQQTPGVYAVEVSMSNLPNAQYIFEFKTPNSKISKKTIKLQ